MVSLVTLNLLILCKEKREYSVLKTLSAGISYFSLKTLGLNAISASAQFVGGSGNALFTAQKGIHFTKKTWAKAMMLTAGNKKAYAALDYFNILQEGNKHNIIDNLSLSTANKVITSENAFVLMRAADKGVQYPVGVAMMLEHMVENGKIVSIQQFVKDKYEYNTTFYNKSKEERDEIRRKIDAEVAELQDKRSLIAIGELDKDGKFSIPGIDKLDISFSDFRSKIKGVNKKIVGNQTRDDINGIRTTLLGTAFMQFKNWIPEMVEDRVAGLQYDPELQTFTYGKLRSFLGDIFSNRAPKLIKAIITGFGENAIDLAKEKYQLLKREAFEKGEDFEISESEFIDIYLGNLKSMMTELTVLIGFAGAVLYVTSGDDDKKKSGLAKYATRALKKYYNEFAFYYNPTELGKLSKSTLPVLGLLEDLQKFVKALALEGYGQVTGDQEVIDNAKPLKYFLRGVPVGQSFMLMMAAADDDFRKEWDIKLESYLN